MFTRPGKPSFSYGFPMVFPFSHGFPMVYHGRINLMFTRGWWFPITGWERGRFPRATRWSGPSPLSRSFARPFGARPTWHVGRRSWQSWESTWMNLDSGWWFGTLLLFSISYMGCHPSHWRTHIFQRGRSTTNQDWFIGNRSIMWFFTNNN